MALALAGPAWVLDHAPGAAAFGAGAFDGEEALARAHFAVAGTGGAGLGLAAGLRAGARAFLARDQRRHADLRILAAIGVFERDLHIVAQIAAAVLPPPRCRRP